MATTHPLVTPYPSTSTPRPNHTFNPWQPSSNLPYVMPTAWHNMLSRCKLFLPVATLTLCSFLKPTSPRKAICEFSHYTIYRTNHPAGTAREGTAIIIKNAIKHHPLPNYSPNYLQATSVSVEDSVGHLKITAAYLPPKHTVCKAQLEDLYTTLGTRFIAHCIQTLWKVAPQTAPSTHRAQRINTHSPVRFQAETLHHRTNTSLRS
jgi:hypothetical protein